MKLFQRLFSRTAQIGTFAGGPPAPERPFFAIGDIHGCDTALGRLLDRIAGIDPDAPLVFVGDYIDRGEQSAQVIARLRRMQAERPGEVICLAGNHEDMLMQFLGSPGGAARRWLDHGGLQMVASYDVRGIANTRDKAELAELRDKLRAAMGAETEAWLRDLPVHWSSGNVSVVHAGADPLARIEDQDAATLMWGHPDFTRKPRLDGRWVIHGHNIVDDPQIEAGRVAIDTGSYATGRITAAHVTEGRIDFVQG